MTQTVRPWRVVASRITFRDRWLTVRSDDCLTADGHRVAPFHVLEYPDWINIVALTREGRLILVREYRHGRGEIVSGLVSGTVEAAERDDPEAAARRELREETGYVGGRFVPVLTAFANPANQTNLVTSFLAWDVEPTGERATDPAEVIAVSLADFAGVLGDLRSGAVRMQAMHVAALWSAAAHIALGVDFPARLRQRLGELLTGP